MMRIIWTIIAVVGVYMAALVYVLEAQAASFTVKTYEGGRTYIEMSGPTELGDAVRLADAIAAAQKVSYKKTDCRVLESGAHSCETKTFNREFSKDLWLSGPGGVAIEGARVAQVVSKEGLDTVVNDRCLSACSLIWLAAGKDDRWVTGDGVVGFHFAYHDDVASLEKTLALRGWHGIQDEIAKTTHYFTAQLLRWGVEYPGYFLFLMSQTASTGSFYEVGVDNIDEAVGGRTF